MEKTAAKNGQKVTSKEVKDLELIAEENRKMVDTKKSQSSKPAAKKTPKKEVAKKGNGGFKANPNSKANKIRQMFKEKSTWSLKEMTKRSGFKNDDNTRCMMSIFKNPGRTKELLVTEFNKEKQTYSLSK